MRHCIYETTYEINIIAKAIETAIKLTVIAGALPMRRQTKRAIIALKKPSVVASLAMADEFMITFLL